MFVECTRSSCICNNVSAISKSAEAALETCKIKRNARECGCWITQLSRKKNLKVKFNKSEILTSGVECVSTLFRSLCVDYNKYMCT